LLTVAISPVISGKVAYLLIRNLSMNNQLPTTVDYILQRGALLNAAGIPVELPLVNPGFYVRDTNAPRGGQPPGASNVWDDPQVTYCEEVEFIWPDRLKLKFPGESQSVIVRGMQPPDYGTGAPEFFKPPFKSKAEAYP
jgi:hypothetical protein